MSIKGRIVAANLAVFGILLSALAYFVYNHTAQSDMDVVDMRLETCAAKIITEFEDEWEEESEPQWDDILEISAEGLSQLRMTLRTIDGQTVFGDESLATPTEEALRSLAAGRPCKEIVISDGQEVRMISFPVPIDEDFRFTLTLAASVDEVRARLDRLAMILFGSVLTVLLVAAAAIYFVTRRYFRPMSQMVTTAEQISANKLDKRLLLPAHADEVTRLGKALNDMMDRLESAFKSQRQFVTDASHELRTPITVIIGDLEYLRSQIDREDLRASIDDALSELDRLTRLVEQLLTLARIDAGKLVLERKRIRLDEILVDCVKLLRKEALKANVRVDVHVETVMEMHGDEVRLKSVILNLLENAIKYSESGGAVAARLRESPAGFAELTVSDSGPGVTDADLPKIFDRFYRGANSRAAGGGSGLGLAIAKEIVELHGGGIHAMANPEGGSLFKVQLPVDEDD